MTTFDESARIAQAATKFDPNNDKHVAIVEDTRRELEAQIPRDMFDKNRANICQNCRGHKITALTPTRLYEGRTLCQCETRDDN